MRLKNLAPGHLNTEQKALYNTLRASIESHLQGFVTSRKDGALIGPFNVLLHFPPLGSAVWGLFKSLADHSSLSKDVREIAILLTGSHHSALYELYAHESVALDQGMERSTVAALSVGQRPAGLTNLQSLAFDTVSTLLRGAPLPNTMYAMAIEAFNEGGLAEIACTIGCYTTIALLLNTFDVALPGTELAD